MKIAIISDLHLGDSLSVMANLDTKGKVKIGAGYREFLRAVRKKTGKVQLDYLVMAGDVLDFSVASYADAYSIGKFFFQKLKDDQIAKEIIYIPGNHDFDLWNTVEYEVNVTKRIQLGKAPKTFRMSVPAIVDDRKKSQTSGLTLFHVKPNQQKNKPRYAGLFMDHLTDPRTPFNFAFPNLYLITPQETVLVTHGQYLEPFWSILGEWSLKVLGSDLDVKNHQLLDLRETAAVNFPLSQIGCAVIGQAGPLTQVIQSLEHDLKEHNVSKVDVYLTRLEKELAPKYFSGFFGLFKHIAFWIGKEEVLKKLSKVQSARYRTEFMDDPMVRKRALKFYESSVYEIEEIKSENGIEIPLPSRMIFGHTHQPIAWGSSSAPSIKLSDGRDFNLYNTGGWLIKKDADGKEEFCGAEVFFYDTKEGFSSEGIRLEI